MGGLSIGLGFFALWGFRYPFGFMAILGMMILTLTFVPSFCLLMMCNADDLAEHGLPVGKPQTLSTNQA